MSVSRDHDRGEGKKVLHSMGVVLCFWGVARPYVDFDGTGPSFTKIISKRRNKIAALPRHSMNSLLTLQDYSRATAGWLLSSSVTEDFMLCVAVTGLLGYLHR